ncbi:MAG: alpha-L-fucosidase [Planctomycetes bacterium]|nr:alpha-L-fucosidase [Planctomycetota bacterium]
MSITFRNVNLALAFAALLGGRGLAAETEAERDSRMNWWREARFGMFIHWGLYAIPAGEWEGRKIPGIGEWIMYNAHIPVAEYEPLAKRFNPVAFDADAWVRIAKDAGMKYIVITTKHHDGFCLFDSKLTTYDIMDATPFERDIMKELSDACRREGIRMCWYHSILDWHHPDYLPRGEGSGRPWDERPKEGASYARYIDYMKGQLRELLTNYGEIGVLWFDGGWEHTPAEHRSEEVVAMIRSIQPRIIINNRIRIPQDFDTPEQTIPATGIPGRDWETCMTMNNTWGYKKDDRNWKSTETLIRNLVDIASKGGNFLLNVGPTAEGRIPGASVERLAEVGRWMKTNSGSIYETTASPFRRLAWGRCTTKPGRLFLHVFAWPKGELAVPGLRNEVKKAYLLSDPAIVLAVRRDPDIGVRVAVPETAPDPIDSVIVLEIEGEPEVVWTISQAADGKVTLAALDATVHGGTARYESGNGKDNIGYWTDVKDSVSWDFQLKAPGAFAVEITYACEKGSAGSEFEVSVGGQKMKAKVRETQTWSTFTAETIGTVKIADAGSQTLSVVPLSKPGLAVMNLKSVRLLPAEQ